MFGNDTTVAFAGSQGNFQLNVYKPVMLHGTLESIELLADALDSFDERCARGIEPTTRNLKRERRPLADAGDRAQPAHRLRERREDRADARIASDLSLREAALKLGLVSAEDFDRWVDPKAMTAAGLAAGVRLEAIACRAKRHAILVGAGFSRPGSWRAAAAGKT